MSVNSITELTLGYLTLPLTSADGCPGSYFNRKSVLSVCTLPSSTSWVSSVRSSSLRKVAIFRRYGSEPGRCGVESALAMFSEMIRMRPAWARKPDAAMVSVLRKSTPSLLQTTLARSAFTERSLEKIETACIERGGGLEIHLVGGHFHHFFFKVHS